MPACFWVEQELQPALHASAKHQLISVEGCVQRAERSQKELLSCWAVPASEIWMSPQGLKPRNYEAHARCRAEAPAPPILKPQRLTQYERWCSTPSFDGQFGHSRRRRLDNLPAEYSSAVLQARRSPALRCLGNLRLHRDSRLRLVPS